MATIKAADLEKAAKDVKLDQMYEDFFKSPGKSSEFDKNCNVFDETGKKNATAKKLCSELVYYLEKIREKSIKEEDSKKYCSYLPYWLYDNIDKIQNSPTTKIDKITFYEDLIKAGNAINGKDLKHTCPLSILRNLDLNELKNRKLSYIYFKNLENIKKIIASKDKAKCTKYLTYLESFKSLHEKYKAAECGSFFFLLSRRTDYFPCNDMNNLSSFVSELQKCKTGDTSDPKGLPANGAKGKGDSGPATLGGQKGSEGATGPKASVGAAGQKASVVTTSSSSSSTTVSTSTAGGTTKTTTVSSPITTTSTTAASSEGTTTTKATATTTVAATKPVTTITQAKTTSAATTTNTVTTTSSSSQGRPSLFSFLLGPSRPTTSERASSLGASQTSSSSSRALGSRASGSSVITTSTPSARGSISSTGQVGQGGLTRAPAAAAVTEKSLSPPSQGSPGYALNPVSSYNSNTGGDTNHVTITDVPGTSETLYDKLDSNTVKNIIMAAAVLGIIFFLFYYNRSSRIETSIKPKKRKKKAFEHNYYEEYEKELAKYESENESLDSLEDRYYLTYQPEGDSYY
ncbi:PIR protein [Plasmodium vivax]|uniref:VIR protein n=1 Tax=Plasmodium vivax TaxID=5855 RepID=A0A565A481_PLAVI|nr:PIR protein [Plasmodium vivax]